MFDVSGLGRTARYLVSRNAPSSKPFLFPAGSGSSVHDKSYMS